MYRRVVKKTTFENCSQHHAAVKRQCQFCNVEHAPVLSVVICFVADHSYVLRQSRC